MRVFVTGATGFIGSAIVKELIGAGHQVIGLARSDSSADALLAAGARVHRGDLEDPDSLRSGAANADGVIHAGFIHDFARFKEVCEVDRIAIETIGAVLEGSDRPFIITSGTALVSPGSLATEDIIPAPGTSVHPRLSEQAGDALVTKGIRVSIVRLSPSVHGAGDHGFVPMLINIAREKGVSAYLGEGLNRWTAVHRLDAAVLYRLALENASPGTRFHGVAEEGILFKDIAEVIGKQLNIPVVSKSAAEAAAHFGWFINFAGLDCPASGKITRESLNWHPSHEKLLSDMEQTDYFNS
ncbi:nucleoside-diphosphate-sugar epimerase [Pedobacter cryoconitis]|uniref:Nucleoside-diphosphate-sugar epimerase n=1 Tax=Pedobacter cryoconitis TaxID=188932 RepID=A0A7W8ZJG5_9SPHI|nr:SDR family oxidoreductase [Pedobacter cryoconitis]MBB5635088.1 nucleoside-diphosphate-sugar epimerase [Pedobacter cryoconitis]